MYPLMLLIVLWIKFSILPHFSKVLDIFKVKSHICIQYKSRDDFFGFFFISRKL